jgi:hypothetical protein
VNVKNIIEKIKEFRELIIEISKLLGAVLATLGVATSLYLSIANHFAIQKDRAENKLEMKLKAAQIEVLQSAAREGFE